MHMEFVKLIPGKDDLSAFEDARAAFYSHPVPANALGKEYLRMACLMYNESGKLAGRFALYDNHDLHHKGQRAVCIGNYECIDDMAASRAMLDKAVKEAAVFGAPLLLGPMNGSTWENFRFTDFQDEHDFFLEPYNHSYYNTQFIDYGFEKIATYFSAFQKELHYEREGLEELEQQFLEQGFRIRNIRLDAYEAEIERIHAFSNEAFSANFLFTPFSRESFMSKYLPLAKFIDPEYVLLAEDAEGKLAAFIFCVRNMMDKKNKTLIIKSVARKPGKQYAGLGNIIGNKINERAARDGYIGIIHALMYEKGSSMPSSRKRGGQIIKTYSLYALDLNKKRPL